MPRSPDYKVGYVFSNGTRIVGILRKQRKLGVYEQATMVCLCGYQFRTSLATLEEQQPKRWPCPPCREGGIGGKINYPRGSSHKPVKLLKCRHCGVLPDVIAKPLSGKPYIVCPICFQGVRGSTILKNLRLKWNRAQSERRQS